MAAPTVRYGPSKREYTSTANSEGTPGSTSAAGHGSHPTNDNNDISGVSPSDVRIGPQNEDLEGDKMRPFGEDHVMHAQLEKEDAGWGEEGSFTENLDRMKREQKSKREETAQERQAGVDIDGGSGKRLQNEGLDQA